MNQDEIFNFLCMQRKTGENKYWRKIEIFNEMKRRGFTTGLYGRNLVNGKVNQLKHFGYLEMIEEENEKRLFKVQRFRVKEEYLSKHIPEVNIFWNGEVLEERKPDVVFWKGEILVENSEVDKQRRRDNNIE